MEQSIKPIKIDDIENKKENKETKKDEKGFIRLDSPVNDNESKILFKYGNNNSNSKDNTENNDKINKNISHDKEIMEDSIIYFSQKLKKNNSEYQMFLYTSILLYFFDIIIWYLDNQILHNNLNFYSLLLILVVSIFQAYSFRHNFESISKQLYLFVQRIIYIYCFSLFLYLSNILYITIFKIILSSGNNNIIYQKRILTFFGFSVITFFYIVINLLIPILVLVELIWLKKNIKNLSAAKGETYETVKIKDSQIINSIIN